MGRQLHSSSTPLTEETLKTKGTFELSFGANLLSFSVQVTRFRNEFKDAITVDVQGNPPTYKYINRKSATRHGVELQMKYDFGRGTYLSMNYTQLYVDCAKKDVVARMEPERLGTLMGNVRLNKYLNLNAYLLYRGAWTRAKDDPREDPGDYVIANATLIAKNFLKELKGLEARASFLMTCPCRGSILCLNCDTRSNPQISQITQSQKNSQLLSLYPDIIERQCLTHGKAAGT